MKEILLTRGKVAIIDDEDFDLVNPHAWYAMEDRTRPGTFIARAKALLSGRRRNVQMHRLIMGEPQGLLVDHKNHDTLDNRRSNLRTATHTQSAANRHSCRKAEVGYKGVFRRVGRRGRVTYRSVLAHANVKHHLGQFPTAELAAKAYDIKAKEFFGEFAYLNFPSEVSE